MKKYCALATIMIAGFPLYATASVFISEVAWMGSSDNANAEWIELYNDGPSTNVTGWTLSATDGQPNITLTGTIGENSYALLERTSDDVVPTVPGFLIYTGAMGNTGEVLELRDENGTLVDNVDGSANWSIGGNNDTKETLQRAGSPPVGNWTTGPPTPEGTTSTSDSSDPQGEVQGVSTKKTSGGNILYGTKAYENKTAKSEPELHIDIGEDRSVIYGVSTLFSAKVFNENNKEINLDDIEWNFGDGAVGKGKEVEHIYEYTGNYIVSATGEYRKLKSEDRIVVQAIEPVLEVTKRDNNYIELLNNGEETLNISEYILISGKTHFVVPLNTFLLPNTSVRLSKKTTGISNNAELCLYYPDGTLLSRYGEKTEKKESVQRAQTVSSYSQASASLSQKEEPLPKLTINEEEDFTSPELLATANVYKNEIVKESDNKRLWWWILGLFSAILTAIVAVLLVRREQEEVIEGFIIESDEK